MTSHEYETIMTELRSLRKRQSALLVIVCMIVLYMITAITFANDASVAIADRNTHPQSDWPYLYYFGLEHLPFDVREETARVLAFAVCSLNSQTVIEHQLPVDVGGVYRIDTRRLGWIHTFPAMLKSNYPYAKHGTLPLVVRADWFIQFSMDQETSGQTYYELLFGRQIKTTDEFFKALNATTNSPVEFGHIEDKSGVAIQRTRMLKSIPTGTRNDVWQTFDFREISNDNDPLQHLDRQFKHDASELIGAVAKSISATGTYGLLQVYALADGNGQIQTKAPTDIVVDSTGVRGVEIRGTLSCVSCHVEGLRPLNTNSLRQYIQSGAELYAGYEAQQDIERFHLTGLDTLIARHNQDYAAILRAINGLTPEANAAAFSRVIRRYDQQLDLGQAARELSTTPDELRLAFGAAGQLPARLAQLVHETPIHRSIWEDNYLLARQYITSWQAATIPTQEHVR